jgi:hypothetical protein
MARADEADGSTLARKSVHGAAGRSRGSVARAGAPRPPARKQATSAGATSDAPVERGEETRKRLAGLDLPREASREDAPAERRRPGAGLGLDPAGGGRGALRLRLLRVAPGVGFDEHEPDRRSGNEDGALRGARRFAFSRAERPED